MEGVLTAWCRRDPEGRGGLRDGGASPPGRRLGGALSTSGPARILRQRGPTSTATAGPLVPCREFAASGIARSRPRESARPAGLGVRSVRRVAADDASHHDRRRRQPERAEYFFNYHYANVALPEVLEMLTHIEAHGHLPSKLMIVQITAPNADNGRFIINHGNELPPDIVLHSAPGASVAERAKAFFDTSWRVAEINLHEVLNYNTLILGALQNDGTIRMTGPAYCATNPPRPSPPDWFKPLPWPVRKILFPYLVRDHCNDKAWDWTLRRDGSAMPETRPLVLDEDKLGPNDRGLHAGDEAEIAKYMRAIDAVGRRHGVKVAFLITPVYETDRHDSVVNRVMDDALSMTKDLTVIDDRPLRTDPTFFVNYLHPSPKYYRDLADRLRAQGLLDGIEPRPPPSTAQQGNHVGKR